jgi:Ca2+-transporting ATPase
METELGHIAQMIQSQDSSTPLQIIRLAKRLSIVILIICTLIYEIGWLNGEAILHAVNVHCRGRHSEALPALVTIALAFAKRLAKVMHLYENFRRWKHLDQLLYLH